MEHTWQKPLQHRWVAPGKRVQLAKVDPRDAAAFPDREEAEKKSKEDAKAINELQDRLFAEGKRALLVVLQGTDTSGKDGTIRHVFNETGPLGVMSRPSAGRAKKSWRTIILWRVHPACPRRGTIGIFNRSHYEDVLVVRVRKLAPAKDDRGALRADQRVREDAGGERHDSPEIHAAHFEEGAGRAAAGAAGRADKRWKFNPRDLEERKLWDQYQAAYEMMLSNCSTPWAPWHVIPADRKWARNAAIARSCARRWRR